MRLIHGDCLEVLPTLADASVDAVVTDPPYHLTQASRNGSPRVPGTGPFGRHRLGEKGFMGKTWDGGDIAFRPETWVAVARVMKPGSYLLAFAGTRTFHRVACAIEDAGLTLVDTLAFLFGTGFPKHKSKLKPAWEPILMAWKPARHATPLPGLDACRIGTEATLRNTTGQRNGNSLNCSADGSLSTPRVNGSALGRWPANLTLDDEAAAMLDEQAGPQKSGGTPPRRPADRERHAYGDFTGQETTSGIGRTAGSVSRFFYCAKASKRDRGTGNTHPTVKPHELCKWLCRLITPPGGTILDPFAGSGSTLLAAQAEGFDAIGIEQEAPYFAVMEKRMAEAQEKLAQQSPLFHCPT